MDVKIGELEDLFERYRSQQDLRALSKLFDLAAPELLRLAVHMAPDVALAEDLVQQTFLAAIEKPQRWRASDPLLPWLFGILANLAKKQRRSMRRTPEVDRLASRSAEDPARHTLDAETQSTIRSALENLPELYREVVRASLFDEKPPHEIARELERAPGTVRMQLLRGLELLRRALPAGLAGGALVLCGTRGEAALKAVVLEKAAVSTALVTSSLTLGGLLVSTKAVLAVVVAVVGLGAWLLWPGEVHEGDIVGYSQDSQGYPAVVKADGQGGTYTEPLPVRAPGETRSAVQTAAAPTSEKPAAGIFLVGRLFDVAPEHAAEIELHVGTTRGAVDGKARPDGSFELDLASAGALPRKEQSPLGFSIKITPPKPVPGESTQIEIWARHARYISEREVVVATDLFAELAPGERREVRCDIRMRPAAIVSGRVRVPAGWDVGQADVDLGPRTPDPADVLELGEEHSGCDAEGKYTIKSLRRGELLVRAKLPGLLPAAVYVKIEPGGELVLPDLVLEESSCSIRGRIDLPPSLRHYGPGRIVMGGIQVRAQRIESAGPAPGALGGVVLDAQSASRVREVRGGSVLAQQSCAMADDSSFLLRGLEPGRWELSIDGLATNGTLPLAEPMIVDAPADGIVLGDQLGSIAILVLDSHGPIKGATATVGDGQTYSTFVAGGDGRILLAGDLRKDYTASAGGSGRDLVSEELPALGRAREVKLELRLSDPPQPGKLAFLVPSGASAPASVQVYLEPNESGSSLQSRSEKLAHVHGRYEITNVEPGRWKIRIGPGEEQIPVAFYGGYLQSELFEVTLAPGATIERTLRCEIGGRLRLTVEADASLKANGLGCKLTSLDGKPCEAPVFVSCVSGEGFGIFGSDPNLMIMGERTQIALQDCLAPGRYELRLTSNEVHAKPLLFEIRQGETTQSTWKIEK